MYLSVCNNVTHTWRYSLREGCELSNRWKAEGMCERMSTRQRVIFLSSKVIKGIEKLEHHPSLLVLPSDVETRLLGATIRARKKGERGKWREQLGKRNGSREAGRIWSGPNDINKEERDLILHVLPRVTEQSSRWRRQSKTVEQRTRQPASISSKEAGCPIISWHAHEFSSQWAARRLLPSTTTQMQRQALAWLRSLINEWSSSQAGSRRISTLSARQLSALTQEDRGKNINELNSGHEGTTKKHGHSWWGHSRGHGSSY